MSIMIEAVKTDEFEMRYFKFGTGDRTAVIIPGLSVKSVMDSAGQVAAAYRAMKEDYTVYVFDRRLDCPDNYTVGQMADDTAKAFDMLGIKDVYLFGVSQGGMIAQLIALDYPELVHKLVLGSTAARVNKGGEKTILNWVRLAKKRDAVSLGRAFAKRVYSEEFYNKYGELIAHFVGNATEEELDRFAVLAAGCEGFDVYDRLNQLKCPVLVIGAGRDKVLGVRASRELAKKAGAQLYIYEDYGHAVYDEAPDYLERVMKFFE
ncbi:MAG: alpha/beta hydrolase [Lachnospiraceae bacterium]|nr:alpha/beta hydrolase [Lachnospiraceae bacterium]